MKEALPIAGVSLGILLVALSFVWGLVFPATNQWTPERAKELSELNQEVHGLMFKAAEAEARPNMVKGGNPAEVIAEYREKKQKLEELNKEFQGIKDSPQTSAKYLRWTGIAFVLLGGLGTMVGKEG